MSKIRVLAACLTISAAGFATWQANEGFTPNAIIPTKGDVPTIGHGSTKWEDGTKVKMTDKITPQRAEILSKNLIKQDEKRFVKSIPGVKLHQNEFDAYIDFIGQFGIGNWNASSMRKNLLVGNYSQACKSLLLYKYSSGYDCSIPGNKICRGVWTRQLERYQTCSAEPK